MTTPDPLRVAWPREVPDRRRLRIMHDIDIVVVSQRLGAALVHTEIEFLLRLQQIVVPALQRIMKRLGNGKEFGLTVNKPPVGVNPECLQHRHIPG